MEAFKQLLQEKKNDSSITDAGDNSFSFLLTDIELCANIQTSFKSNRTTGKILHQELNACQRESEEQNLIKSHCLNERNALLSSLEEKKALIKIEADRKCLNMIKRVVKVVWVHAPPNYLEGFVFNEHTGYLKHFSYEMTDSSIRQKLRNEMNLAANHDSTNHSILF